jgi:hypothetical protein
MSRRKGKDLKPKNRKRTKPKKKKEDRTHINSEKTSKTLK